MQHPEHYQGACGTGSGVHWGRFERSLKSKKSNEQIRVCAESADQWNSEGKILKRQWVTKYNEIMSYGHGSIKSVNLKLALFNLIYFQFHSLIQFAKY